MGNNLFIAFPPFGFLSLAGFVHNSQSGSPIDFEKTSFPSIKILSHPTQSFLNQHVSIYDNAEFVFFENLNRAP